MKIKLFITLVAASVHANAAFIGPYAVENWTQDPAIRIDLSGAPNSIMLTSANDGGGAKSTLFFITATTAGVVSFSWDYVTTDEDGPGLDPFRFYTDTPSNFIQLTASGGGDIQAGSEAFSVLAGQVFGFDAFSDDSTAGAATTTIYDFSFQGATVIPETGNMLALAMLIGGGLLFRTRRAG